MTLLRASHSRKNDRLPCGRRFETDETTPDTWEMRDGDARHPATKMRDEDARQRCATDETTPDVPTRENR
jgi:hypothetical protein